MSKQFFLIQQFKHFNETLIFSHSNSMYNLSATKAFKVVKTFLTTVSIWPYDKKKLGRYKALAYDVIWNLLFFNIVFGCTPIYLNIYFARDQLIIMMESASIGQNGGDTALNLILTRYYRVELMVKFLFIFSFIFFNLRHFI